MNSIPLSLLLAGVLAVISSVPALGAEGGRASLLLDGRVRVEAGAGELSTFTPLMANPQWRFADRKAASYKQEGESRRFGLKIEDASVAGEATVRGQDGKVEGVWTFAAEAEQEIACLGVSADLAADLLKGGTWKAGDQQGSFPAELNQVHLFDAEVSSVTVVANDGRSLTIDFPKPTPVLIQDNRRWSQTFSVRLGRRGGKLAKGERYELPMTISMPGSTLTANVPGPLVITAGEDWVPLKSEQEIEPGSALDFSSFGFADGPAGKHGWVIATPEGHFAFENDPQRTPRRFYGINLCFDAHYLPKEQIDQLCDRLVRLGYNTLRIHHYEARLTDWRPGYDWSPQRIDQLDYLLAACGKRGIYVTTDLYVSRPVSAEQVGMPGEQRWDYRLKILVPVHEPAFKDWEAFTRKLLDRTNPHTGRRWADDPTLAWLSMINEGNFGNYWKDIKPIPQWTTAWNKWLSQRYPDRAALAQNWGDNLKAEEDPAKGTVALPDSVHGNSPRHRDCIVFLAETERDMFARMTKFLRDEVKCRAMLTNMNAWTNHAPSQVARGLFDYVDDHFYVDHPQFLENDWRLPSRCDNTNPIKGGAAGGRGGTCLRVFGKPFTISEYNYSGPGRFRGVGGILTGAMAALQDWDVIWRFAYSHSDKNLFTPTPIGYFDLVSDPLQQAADRAAVMLYLRGDLKPATGRIAMVMTGQELLNPPANRVPSVSEGPQWAGWVTRVGTALVDDKTPVPQDAIALPLGWADAEKATEGLTAFGTDPAKLLAALKDRGIVAADNPTDPARNVFQSETGEVLIHAPTGLLRFDTPRTAGGYAEPGQTLSSPSAGVEVVDLSIGATVFVTSVDNKPIKSSARLLVTHLTDLQNTDATYADPDRQILVDWGKLPHLVRAGSAIVRLAVEEPSAWTVHALSTGGQRLAEVPTRVEDNKLTFTCDVRGPEGARMLYEVVRR